MSQLKAVRQQRGWSQARTIAALQAQARAAGVEVPGAASLKTQMSRWENGHRSPNAFYRRLLEQVFGLSAAELGLTTERADVNDTLDVGTTWEESAHRATHLWREDMNRRELLKSTGFAAAAFVGPPVVKALVSKVPAEPSRAGAGRSVGERDVQVIRDMISNFGGIDNQHGGGTIRRAAVGYLSNEVGPLLTAGRFAPAAGRSLFAASAELTLLVGWMSHDVGAHALGQRYLIQALGLARSANDDALISEIMAAMSHQAIFLKDGHTAIDLARAANQIAQRRGISTLSAEAHVMEAHGHATNGDAASCAHSLSAAEKALDTADRTSDPGWIGYFDESYLAAKFGHCFVALGESANAVRFAERSLQMDTRRYARGYAFNLSLLAHAHAHGGEVEQACAVGEQAVTASTGLQSSRAVTYVQRLRRALPDHAPCVQQLDTRLAGLVA